MAYHDTEWGIQVHDDDHLFEMLVLECFQAGLSWECVLNKRENFRKAFDDFHPDVVSGYGDDKIGALMHDAGIIRNRSKICASIRNAGVFMSIRDRWGSFDSYIWNWTDGNILYECCRVQSDLSRAISDDLRSLGMKFAGPVVIYSYLQGIGIINSHEPDCFLHCRPAS